MINFKTFYDLFAAWGYKLLPVVQLSASRFSTRTCHSRIINVFVRQNPGLGFTLSCNSENLKRFCASGELLRLHGKSSFNRRTART